MSTHTSIELGPIPEDSRASLQEIRFRIASQEIAEQKQALLNEIDQKEAKAIKRRIARIRNFALGVSAVASAVGAVGFFNMRSTYDNSVDNPHVIPYAYTLHLGAGEYAPMVSEVADDIHAVAPNQNQAEETQLITTYLPQADRVHETVANGESFTFFINTETGKLIPNPYPNSSSGNAG